MKITKLLYYLFLCVCLWTAGTGIIQAFKCPKMTHTQLFLNIPQSFILNFQ